MNRRDFLVRSSMFTAAGLLARSTASAQVPSAAPAPKGPPAATPDFQAIRRNVGYFTARGGAIGWLVNKDAVVAVDTQFPDTAKLFLDGLPGRDGRRLDATINTHHHGDHTGGNAVFKPESKIIVGHANVPELQKARAAADKKGDTPTPPDTTFADTWKKDFGDETISLKYFGAAHTRGDIVTHFEKANVIHMGDLAFNRIYPVIDRPGGGRIKGWISVLDAVAKTYPADAIYVFGHANPKFSVKSSLADLKLFRDYLAAMYEYAEKQVAAGQPKEEIIKLENLLGFTDFHLPRGPQNRLPLNLGVAFDELTEKKA